MKKLLFLILWAFTIQAQMLPTYFPTYEANRGKGNGKLFYRLYSTNNSSLYSPSTAAEFDAFFPNYTTFQTSGEVSVASVSGTTNSSSSSVGNLINFTSADQLKTAINLTTPYTGFNGDYFSLIVSGYFIPKQTGTYNFSVEGDDAVDIMINGVLIANHYGAHAPSAIGTHAGSISLVAGKKYNLRARFMEINQGEAFNLFWQKPSEAGLGVWYQDTEELSSEEILPNGLVLNFDPSNMNAYPKSGTQAFDLKGNATGTIGGNTTYSALGQGSFVTDGNQDYIDFTKTPANFPTGNISVFVWVRASSLTNGWNIILTKWFTDYIGNGGYADFHFAIYPSGGNYYQNLYTTTTSNMFGSIPLTSNTWYQVGFTISNGSMQMYLNGALDGSVRSGVGRTNYTQSYLWLGDARINVGGLIGNIGSLAIYNRAISFDEVIQNYNATKTKYGY